MSNVGRESFEPITGEAALAARDAGKITDGVKQTIARLYIDGGDDEIGNDDPITPKEGNSLAKMIAKHGGNNGIGEMPSYL